MLFRYSHTNCATAHPADCLDVALGLLLSCFPLVLHVPINIAGPARAEDRDDDCGTRPRPNENLSDTEKARGEVLHTNRTTLTHSASDVKVLYIM